jgi:hypothetical protein
MFRSELAWPLSFPSFPSLPATCAFRRESRRRSDQPAAHQQAMLEKPLNHWASVQ